MCVCIIYYCRMGSALSAVMRRIKHSDSMIQIQALTVSMYVYNIYVCIHIVMSICKFVCTCMYVCTYVRMYINN